MNLDVHWDRALFHTITLDALYASLVLLTFVILERLFYYAMLYSRLARVTRWAAGQGLAGSRLGHGPALASAVGADIARTVPAGQDVLTRSVRDYVMAQEQGATRHRVEDLSADLFIRVDSGLNARLWILDTIVTAAPLLGLLGTILGIMDTFNALSAGGVSDPGAVSRGIGDALAATAIGIGTALYGLVGHNVLHRQAEHMTEAFKGLILRTTTE